ncbi:hypothetical protein L345_18266, partial [Ophiophagus hannah]
MPRSDSITVVSVMDVLFWHTVTSGDDEAFTPAMEEGADLEEVFRFGLVIRQRQIEGGGRAGVGRVQRGAAG